jgi:hypothetical protein
MTCASGSGEPKVLPRSKYPWLIDPNNIRIEHLWILAPFFVTFIRAFRVPLQLMDFWWHLKLGEIIVTTRSIPTTDLFSFTAAGRPFLVDNWLAEIAYYLIYRLGGLPLIVFLNAVLYALALSPIFLLCRESTRQIRLAAFATLLACLAFAGNARPQVFSFAFFAFFYWVLDGFRFRRRNMLWILPFAMVVWVNVHGAFVLGLGLVALYLASESLRHIFNAKDALPVNRLLTLAFVLPSCMAATLVSPQSYRVYGYVRLILSDRVVQHMVTEWQRPRIDSFEGALFYCTFLLAIAGFAVMRRQLNLTDMVLIAVFARWGATAYRNIIWFAFIAAPILTRYWTKIKIAWDINRLQTNRSPEKQAGTGATRSSASSLYRRFNLILLIGGMFFLIITSPWIRPIVNGASLIDSRTPVKAIDYIEQHGLRGHIFHPLIFGDYLIWRLYPQQRSFFDGRVHLFGADFVRKYQDIFDSPDWESMLAPFDIRYLLLSKEDEECKNLIRMVRDTKHWTVLFEDGISILYERTLAVTQNIQVNP